MLSVLARSQISKQVFEPTRLILRQNLVNKSQKQCFKTSRGIIRRNNFEREQSSISKLFESRIFRATISAVGGSVIFFGCATIWTYENVIGRKSNHIEKQLERIKKQFERTKKNRNDFDSSDSIIFQIKNFFQHLREDQKLFYLICGLNLLVLAAWRVPQLEKIMFKYFTVNLATKKTFLPMLLSQFSHKSPLHFFINMYCLSSFIAYPTSHWGKETTLAVYLSAGMFGGLFSICNKLYRANQLSHSLGASAALLGLVSSTCIIYPDSRLAIIFLPGFTFTAQNALIGLILVDLTGVILKLQFIDHCAHLGGTLFGVFYTLKGHEWFKNYYRTPFFKAWHKIRHPEKRPSK